MTYTIPLRAKSSLKIISKSLNLRIDSKQVDPSCLDLDEVLDGVETFRLNEFLPAPIIKGKQPIYLDENEEPDGSAAVISTLCVRPLSINFRACRRMSIEHFDNLSQGRKLVGGDVLLTVDGGTSIGKAAVFYTQEINNDAVLAEGFTVDSHVAILRPHGMSSELLSYLLCSPMGQIQFQRAESGASGQTAVSEDDIRSFRFPRANQAHLETACQRLTNALKESRELEFNAYQKRQDGWDAFESELMHAGKGKSKRFVARIRPSERRMQQIADGQG